MAWFAEGTGIKFVNWERYLKNEPNDTKGNITLPLYVCVSHKLKKQFEVLRWRSVLYFF
jgi:hypothetical protein